MSATRPAQIPATSQRSEILSRISQGLIAKRQVLAVKIGLVLNLNSKTVLALSIRQFRRALGSFDGKVELACFRVGCRERSNEEWIVLLRDSIQVARQFNGPYSISQRIIRACRH